MKIEFTNTFTRDLKKIKDKSLLVKIKMVILNIESSTNTSEIQNIKFIVGSKYYYRIRVGDYRIGFKLINDKILLIRCLDRKEIYKKFP